MKPFLLLSFIGGLVVFSSCTHETTLQPNLEETVYFNTQILPMFQNTCAVSGCHNSVTKEDGYDLSNYASIISKGIIPGDATKSLIYKTITGESKLMPPNNPLPIDQRTLVKLWIDQGAEETIDPGSLIDTTNIDSIPPASFAREVQSILISNCASSGCHDAATAEMGYDFTSYESAVNKGVIAYDAAVSKVYRVIIASENEANFMPPSPRNRLSSEQSEVIANWINRGAKNEVITEVCDPLSTNYSDDIESTINSYCQGCHQADAAEGGVILENKAQLTAIGNNGQLVNALNGTNGASIMPPIGSLSNCEKEKILNWVDTLTTTSPDPQGALFCFSRDVHPILTSNCGTSGCHDAATHEEGYNFTSYETTIAKGVISGNANQSKIYKVITTSQNEDDFMPPSPRSPLTNEQISAIKKWIDEGIKDEECAVQCDANEFDFVTNISPLIKSYCQGCHQANAANGGVILETEAQIKAIANDGRLVNTLNATNGYSKMPPVNNLTSCEIEQITNWVNSLSQ